MEASDRVRVRPSASAAWIQLGVLVNDGSGSMTWPIAEGEPGAGGGKTKGQAVDEAVKGLVGELQNSRRVDSFCLSCISFNDRVTGQTPAMKVKEMSLDENYDPTANGTGATAIHVGLDAAVGLLEAFTREGIAHEVPASAVVVLLSDGEETDSRSRTEEVAKKIKQMPNVRLAACLFATAGQEPAGEELLQRLVSEPQLYKRVHSAEELRRFFWDSVTSRRQLPPGPQ